jgi:hypothetical protein
VALRSKLPSLVPTAQGLLAHAEHLRCRLDGQKFGLVGFVHTHPQTLYNLDRRDKVFACPAVQPGMPKPRRDGLNSRFPRKVAIRYRPRVLRTRDRALAVAQQNYQAWANARSQILQLHREVADAKGSANAGWVAALVGTVGGAILGSAAAS